MDSKDKEIRNTSGQQNRQADSDHNNQGFRNKNQAQDTRGEAQNVNDDTGRPLYEDELQKARNKATEGMKQGRGR